jgi:hypothetical protein
MRFRSRSVLRQEGSESLGCDIPQCLTPNLIESGPENNGPVSGGKAQ